MTVASSTQVPSTFILPERTSLVSIIKKKVRLRNRSLPPFSEQGGGMHFEDNAVSPQGAAATLGGTNVSHCQSAV